MGTTAFMSVPYSLNVDPTDELQSLSISGDTLFISSGNYIIFPSSTQTLLGCTDSTAFNYNQLANTDDGSCVTYIYGCTDSTAFNYNPLANTYDGSCIAVVNGCTDSTAYSGYNPLANTDDGSCVAVALGCTDPLYTEYDPLANTDDGTCITLIVNGCTDSTALNYDSLANTDDGNCILPVLGCTDSTAFNYNPLATIDDNLCIPIVNGCTNSIALNYDTLANTDDGSCVGIGDNYQGGIIFWLDGNGGGLIAAPTDQSFGAEWGCYGTAISGADGTAIGTGAQNTIDIEAGCPTSGTAADICANLTLGGYSDWFLPSKGELNQMYLNIGKGNALGLGNIGGFPNDNCFYWSSTEDANVYAWKQNFKYGPQSINIKYNYVRVRAVRAF